MVLRGGNGVGRLLKESQSPPRQGGRPAQQQVTALPSLVRALAHTRRRNPPAESRRGGPWTQRFAGSEPARSKRGAAAAMLPALACECQTPLVHRPRKAVECLLWGERPPRVAKRPWSEGRYAAKTSEDLCTQDGSTSLFSMEPMRQSRLADEQMTAILREADRLRETKKSGARPDF